VVASGGVELLKDLVQGVDALRMRRLVAGGLGVAAVAWALGSSDWRNYWSEFWSTARIQIRESDAITPDHDSMSDASVSTDGYSVSLP
jgi:hypothetical protein